MRPGRQPGRGGGRRGRVLEEPQRGTPHERKAGATSARPCGGGDVVEVEDHVPEAVAAWEELRDALHDAGRGGLGARAQRSGSQAAYEDRAAIPQRGRAVEGWNLAARNAQRIRESDRVRKRRGLGVGMCAVL